MSDTSATPPFDVPRAHRWFAVETNNLAWDLLDAADRSPADTQRMLSAAHAAAFHWGVVGTSLNHLRAFVLLATASLAAGENAAAVAYGRQATAMLHAVATATAFDRAGAWAALGAALTATGGVAEAAATMEMARAAANGIDDPADRAVLDRFYPALRSS